jgi:predicted metalloprotease with PDZ domain
MPRSTFSRRLASALSIAGAAGCGSAPPAAAAPSPAGPAPTIHLAVDATDAPRHLLRAHMTLPVKPGALTLAYPKWIPGEHGATGPLVNLIGPILTAGGKKLEWKRDSERLYEFHVEVPKGVSELSIDLEFLEPAGSSGFSAGSSTTPELADLAWNHLLLYPLAWAPEQLTYVAQLKLPTGWKFGTALPVAHDGGDTIDFAPASLVTLIDSPVVAGAHTRVIPLGPDSGPKHEIDLVADSEEALEMTAQQMAAYKQLVAEATALFGAHHYRDYHFLYTLSDGVASFGLEHHESSDDRVGERALIDDDLRHLTAGLLPHEFVHSWNGKYRRPSGLATKDYQEPMRGDLLWVYEGLTEYLGWVLTGRSGLSSDEEEREGLASTAAVMEATPGRLWRPLEDTAIAAQVLYGAGSAGESMRRSVDYYPEGLLVWLDADVIIRQKTQGKASLDDFCKAFHGGKESGPEMHPYDLDEIVKKLNDVAPYDWKGFFDERIVKANAHAPIGGITGGGYKLVYNEEPNARTAYAEHARKFLSLRLSLGAVLSDRNEVLDVVDGAPAAMAGLAPGMRVVAVDGRRMSREVMHAALERAKKGTDPIELLVENGDYFKTLKVTWHGGERHAHLEREPGQPDILTQILAPRTPRPPEAVAAPPKTDEDAKKEEAKK